MRVFRLLPLISLILTGCMGTEAEYRPPPRKNFADMTAAEKCMNLLELSGDVYLNDGQRMAAYEMAHNNGCMGQAQPQTVIVR